MMRYAAVLALGLVVCAIGHAQVAPNGALPGLPMSLLPPSPTSADNLRLIVPERQCIGSVRYLENPYRVSKGLATFFATGSKAGIQARHAKRLNLQLAKLDSAQMAEDMNLPGWKLHPLRGDLRNHWAVWVDQNWRMTFKFENGHAILVDYRDYH